MSRARRDQFAGDRVGALARRRRVAPELEQAGHRCGPDLHGARYEVASRASRRSTRRPRALTERDPLGLDAVRHAHDRDRAPVRRASRSAAADVLRLDGERRGHRRRASDHRRGLDRFGTRYERAVGISTRRPFARIAARCSPRAISEDVAVRAREIDRRRRHRSHRHRGSRVAWSCDAYTSATVAGNPASKPHAYRRARRLRSRAERANGRVVG